MKYIVRLHKKETNYHNLEFEFEELESAKTFITSALNNYVEDKDGPLECSISYNEHFTSGKGETEC